MSQLNPGNGMIRINILYSILNNPCNNKDRIDFNQII